MTEPSQLSQEDNGKWVAECKELPGLKCYGSTKAEALAKLNNRAKSIVAERRERGLDVPTTLTAIIYANRNQPSRWPISSFTSLPA